MGSAFPRQCASYQTRLVYPQAFFFFIEHKFVCRSVDTNAFHTPLSIYSPFSLSRRYLYSNAITSIPINAFTTLTALTQLWVPHVCFSWCFHVNPSPEFAGLPQSKMCTLCHKLFLGFSLWPRHFICLSSHSHVCVMMQDSLPVTCFFGNSLFPWDAHYPYILPSCLCQCELWRHLISHRRRPVRRKFVSGVLLSFFGVRRGITWIQPGWMFQPRIVRGRKYVVLLWLCCCQMVRSSMIAYLRDRWVGPDRRCSRGNQWWKHNPKMLCNVNAWGTLSTVTKITKTEGPVCQRDTVYPFYVRQGCTLRFSPSLSVPVDVRIPKWSCYVVAEAARSQSLKRHTYQIHSAMVYTYIARDARGLIHHVRESGRLVWQKCELNGIIGGGGFLIIELCIIY